MKIGKDIVIIGGGISGLATLHYLKKRFQKNPDVKVTLLEKEESCGGTIQSQQNKRFIFETGPNGFLDNRQTTREFVEELDLSSSLIHADDTSKIRYLYCQNKLHRVPSDLTSFFQFPLLSAGDKARILGEFFLPKIHNPQETIYDFGVRRFGKRFTEHMLDPIATGIFAGDIQKLVLKSAFPRIHALEHDYGSLVLGMVRMRRALKKKAKGRKLSKGVLTSFKNGMGELIQTLADRYSESILTQQEIIQIQKQKDQYTIQTHDATYNADALFVCTPANAAAELLQKTHPAIYDPLRSIHYASLAVVGLLFDKNTCKIPEGFGYLTPSAENHEVLGVLFESQIFPQRFDENHVFLRIMLGGVHHPQTVEETEEELIDVCRKEIKTTLGIDVPPIDVAIKIWKKGIPQYDQEHFMAQNLIPMELERSQNLCLVANYLGGVSLNDCIINAQKAAQSIFH